MLSRKVKETLKSHPELSLYINQEPGNSKSLLIMNPAFGRHSYTEKGLLGKVDEKRERFFYHCHFRDLDKDSRGEAKAVIIFTNENEAYFESFYIYLTHPVTKTIVVQDLDIEDIEQEVPKFREPRVFKDPADQERHKPKF